MSRLGGRTAPVASAVVEIDSDGCGVPALRVADRDLLALIAGGNPPMAPRRSAEDSQELLEYLLRFWQLIPMLSTATIDGPLAEAMIPGDHRRLCHARHAVDAFMRAQTVAARSLLELFAEREFQYTLLKGSATAFVLYDEPHMRGAWDLDVGVEPSRLKEAESLALSAGYRPAQQDGQTKRFYVSDPELRARVEAEHYELGFLVRRLQVANLPEAALEAIRLEPWTHQFWFGADEGTPWCYASVDVHHGISLDLPLEDLLADARPISPAGYPDVTVPSDVWLAFYLIFKLYWEGVHNYGKGLYNYADLVRLTPRLDEETFGRVVGLLARFNLLAAGHYVVRRLPCFGVDLAEHLRSFVEQTQVPPATGEPAQLNDQGDMWAKLRGRR